VEFVEVVTPTDGFGLLHAGFPEDVGDQQVPIIIQEVEGYCDHIGQGDILKTLAEEDEVVSVLRLKLFIHAFEDAGFVTQKLTDLFGMEMAGREAINLVAEVEELLRIGAGAAADVEDGLYAGGDMGDEELGVVALGLCQIGYIEGEVVGPVAVVQVVDLEEVLAENRADLKSDVAG